MPGAVLKDFPCCFILLCQCLCDVHLPTRPVPRQGMQTFAQEHLASSLCQRQM